MVARGDDLDDDYAPDDLVAVSDDEEENNHFAPLHGEEDQFASDADAAEDADDDDPTSQQQNPPSSKQPSSSKSLKRTQSQMNAPNDVDEAKKEKKRKKRAKDNERKAKKQRLTLVNDVEPTDSTITATQSPARIASLLRKGHAQVLGTLTEVELEDIAIPESCIVDTREWTGERTHETLAAFIQQVVPTLATRIGQSSKNNGAPTCIMLAANANRVTDLTRSFRPLKGEKGGEVCKLFARHFTLAQHVEHLKKTKVGVAIGTPSRVSTLLNDTDALITKALSHIILDVTYMDTKQRSMLDTRETKDEIFKSFFKNEKVMERLKNGKCQLVLF
ncbi:hypothetical protein DL93DRAFT_2083459 [Clavulina sp. PMI_390]|nr:hypothetical protein DL93DRAFT_2083459 [Clavulina sp. PMI_390]